MQTALRPSNRIKWPSAYIEATTAQERFEEVHLVTAKCEFVNHAQELAAERVMRTGEFSDLAIAKATQQLIASQQLYVQESVKIDETGIQVCINADNVEDDAVMYRALDMLADAMYQLDGENGTITFGGELSFSISEVPWVITQ